MAKIICICGKIGCGKTYHAKQLLKKENAVILSTDEVTYDLTNNKQGKDYDEFAKRVNLYLRKKAVEIVKTGSTVILDWGFWKKTDREEIKKYCIQNNVKIEMHYLEIDDKTWKKNIQERNDKITKEKGGPDFYIDNGLIEKVTNIFEEPTKDEIDKWYKVERT